MKLEMQGSNDPENIARQKSFLEDLQRRGGKHRIPSRFKLPDGRFGYHGLGGIGPGGAFGHVMIPSPKYNFDLCITTGFSTSELPHRDEAFPRPYELLRLVDELLFADRKAGP